MKFSSKKFIALMMAVILFFGGYTLLGMSNIFDINALAAEYSVGDHIYFGSYPQSEVKDEATLSALNSSISSYDWDEDWISYGHYSGDGSYGSMVQGDWMKFADVTHDGDKYRAVKFTQYRPYWTGYSSSASNSYQDDNGYELNKVYWFKYEPIEWRVLDPAKGLIVAETCMDSQAYSNTFYSYDDYYWNDTEHTQYASDYATSSIRKWLNDDFYNTAFNDTQKSQIATTTLDNTSAYSSEYDSETTNDKVFLLSYDDAINPAYGFSSTAMDYDAARRAKSTDYAKSQGCMQNPIGSYAGKACWWLRNPGDNSDRACIVYLDGLVSYSYYVVYSYLGVRPALMLNLKSIIEIKIETNPTVTSYKVGDEVSLAGLKVMAVYSDTSEIDVTSSVTVSNFDASTAGDKTATVEFKGKTATFNYTVTEDDSSETPIFESIRIETNPTVTNYKVGDTVSTSGLKVIAVYSDTSEIDVTSSVTVSNFNASTAGNKTATVFYNGKTATFYYTVEEDTAPIVIPTVKINNNPGTKEIKYGEGIKFTAMATNMPEGAKIVWFVNDKKADEGENFTFSDAKSNTTITVKIMDKNGNILKASNNEEISDSQTVTVKAGFFQKLISFFKNLFKKNRIIVQSIDSKKAH